ncbi:MAG: holo-[acyl-carrier-protein] synthase [Proteobacteria bacterium]|nr:MAG: holo-[acyl-carrier-protein] synthase [Pseudomonadota bacterium]
MIIGIGVDKVVISRIENSIFRFPDRFVQRVYTSAEYELAKAKGLARRLAMFFAAKEAVSKALGTGFMGFSMKDIEVIYQPSGKPDIVLHAGALAQAKALGVAHVHLSLSDDNGVALAFAIAESA